LKTSGGGGRLRGIMGGFKKDKNSDNVGQKTRIFRRRILKKN